MNNKEKIINNKLLELSNSKFRNSFHLRKYMVKYIDEKGMNKILIHAYDFVNRKLVVLNNNDGKQIPMKGHPVFIAMHACACCCRGCLEKWHHIPKDTILTKNEINYIISIIIEWIKREYSINNKGVL